MKSSRKYYGTITVVNRLLDELCRDIA